MSDVESPLPLFPRLVNSDPSAIARELAEAMRLTQARTPRRRIDHAGPSRPHGRLHIVDPADPELLRVRAELEARELARRNADRQPDPDGGSAA